MIETILIVALSITTLGFLIECVLVNRKNTRLTDRLIDQTVTSGLREVRYQNIIAELRERLGDEE